MPSQAERDALVARYTEYAHALGRDIARTLPGYVSLEDLNAAAVEGLLLAASRYDPARGVAFTTFAYYRIRGAVFDFIRHVVQTDPYKRARASQEAAVDDLVETALGERRRAPNEGPAEAADLLASVLDTAARAFTVADCAEALLSESAQGRSTEDQAGRLEAARGVREALGTLPEKERTMMRAVYFEGRTIEEAGATLGLSKSWASRLHARALAQLRELLPQFQP